MKKTLICSLVFSSLLGGGGGGEPFGSDQVIEGGTQTQRYSRCVAGIYLSVLILPNSRLLLHRWIPHKSVCVEIFQRKFWGREI